MTCPIQAHDTWWGASDGCESPSEADHWSKKLRKLGQVLGSRRKAYVTPIFKAVLKIQGKAGHFFFCPLENHVAIPLKHILAAWKRRWLITVYMDLQKLNHPLPTCLLSMIKMIIRFMVIGVAMNIIYLDTGKVPQYLCIRVRTLHSEWMDS